MICWVDFTVLEPYVIKSFLFSCLRIVTWTSLFISTATDGWQYWFSNSRWVVINADLIILNCSLFLIFTFKSDADARKLLKNLELVSDVDEGLRNVTQAFFWGYAFLGSREQLRFMIQNNLTNGWFQTKTFSIICCLFLFFRN